MTADPDMTGLDRLAEYIERCTRVYSPTQCWPFTAMHSLPNTDLFPGCNLWVVMPYPFAYAPEENPRCLKHDLEELTRNAAREIGGSHLPAAEIIAVLGTALREWPARKDKEEFRNGENLAKRFTFLVDMSARLAP